MPRSAAAFGCEGGRSFRLRGWNGLNARGQARHAVARAHDRRSRQRDDCRYLQLDQAEALLDVLVEDRPFDVADLWEDLWERGPKWQALATAGLQSITPPIRIKVTDILAAKSL